MSQPPPAQPDPHSRRAGARYADGPRARPRARLVAGLLALGALATAGGILAFLASRGVEPRSSSGDGMPPPSLPKDLGAPSPIALPATPASAVDVLRTQVVAGGDRFRVEAMDQMLSAPLRGLEALLRAPRRAPPPSALAGVFAPAVVALLPVGEGRVALADPPLEVRIASKLQGDAYEEVRGAEALMSAFASRLEPLDALDRSSIKTLHIVGDFDAGPVETRTYLELGGSLAGGARRSLVATLAMRFVLANGQWRLARLEAEEVQSARLERPLFVDETARLVGADPLWRELLRPGIDALRDRLDAALGVDIYGHHGISVGDANGDEFEDLYIPMPSGVPNLLFLGRPDGSYEERGRALGVDVLDGTHQALFLDLEGDGDSDLVLITDGGVLILANEGAAGFQPRPDAVPAIESSRSTFVSAAAADYDLDGDLDIYVAAYVFWRGSATAVGSPLPFPYHEAHNGARNILLRNRGDGVFEDATESAGLEVGNGRFSFAAAFGDHDDDGDPDLYVANDFGSNNLYRNEGDGRFTEVTTSAGVADVGAGMSVAWEDYDSDGDLDLYVGNMLSAAGRRVTGTDDYKRESPALQAIYRRHARGNSLFRNPGHGSFEDVSEESRAYFGRWAWGSGFIDLNLDGRDDLYVQNGFISNERKDDL